MRVEADHVRIQDQNSVVPPELLGHVLSVSGSQASVGILATSQAGAAETRVTVGQFLVIRSGNSLLIGVITNVSLTTIQIAREQGYYATAELDLMGEIKKKTAGSTYFQRGVTAYPAIGDAASLITNGELRLVYDISGSDTINIGHLLQDNAIGAYINIDDMLSKHFAVLGTTGVGKSSGVAVILQQILEARPDLRIFLLDGHNEYGRCFGDRAQVLTPAISSCRSGCSISRKSSTSFSAPARASRKRWRSCPKSSRSPRAPTPNTGARPTG